MDSNSLNISITKEQLSELPIVTFPGAISVIETIEEAVEALARLSDEPIIGFDTETKPTFRKGHTNTVALIQMSTLDHSYLFRLNKIGFIDEMRRFFENPSVTKVGLSLKDDFFVLHRIHEFEPEGFIDLQQFVKQYNISDCSLQKIYGIIFNGRISKSQRLSNWEASQLSTPQQIYASIDAWACLRIYNYLTSGEFHPAESPYQHTAEQ